MATKRVPKVDIGDGIQIPAELSATETNADGYTIEVTARYDAGSGRYVARSVTVKAQDGREVTGEALRRIQVASIVRLIAQGAMAPYMAQWPRELAATGPTTETLQQVARIYRLALLAGDAPAQAVASALDIPRSTASRWATRARDRGYLTVTDPRAARVE